MPMFDPDSYDSSLSRPTQFYGLPYIEKSLGISPDKVTQRSCRLESEARYYSDRFTECANNLNKTWKIIKQILNSNEAVGLPTKSIIGKLEINDPNKIA